MTAAALADLMDVASTFSAASALGFMAQPLLQQGQGQGLFTGAAAAHRIEQGQRLPQGRVALRHLGNTRMARKLSTKKGREIYAKRKTIPESVFGQIKEGRGLRRFLMRGLEKVYGECAILSPIFVAMGLRRAWIHP
jgi:hypothetical protein